MPSRIDKICDSVLEATWLAALIVTPLFFDVYSQRVFEPDKISVMRSLALIALVTWIVKKISGLKLFSREDETEGDDESEKEVPLWRKPLVLPVLLLAAAYLLSTLLSVTPRQSFWGSYQRLQGTLTMFSYMAFFIVVLDTLRTRAQWRRLHYTIILTSLPIALYGILQHYELDSLPWGGKTVDRVTGNMGNAIFLAAYLIMVIPLTLERLITAVRRMLIDEEGNTADALAAGALLFVLIVQVIGLVFTQSRGPWLGFAAGAYIFLLLGLTSLRQRAPDKEALRPLELAKGIGLGIAGVLLLILAIFAVIQYPGLGGVIVALIAVLAFLALYLVPILNRRGWRWLWLSVITQAIVLGILLVFLNIPNTPFVRFSQTPYAGRLAQIMETDSGTGRVRVLIWQGVLDMMGTDEKLIYPDGSADTFAPVRTLVGYGPESMWVAYNRFYRPELGGLEKRNASPDRSHNETFDSLAITGVIGFLAYFLMFGSVFYYALRWLGLIGSKRDRSLFILFGVVGAALGILTPVLLGVTHFAGVGVAVGFITGIMIYVTFAAFRGGDSQQTFDRRHLLIIALLATVVSHFVEIHFGISIVATRSYFFIFMGALAAIGMGQINFAEEPLPEIPKASASASTSGRRRQRRSKRNTDKKQTTPSGQPLWLTILPYALIASIILLIINFDFITNQTGSEGLFNVFWQSWTSHLDKNGLVPGPGPLWIVLFTLIVGLVFALGETWRTQHTNIDVIIAAATFLGITLFSWLFYGLMQAGRLQPLPSDLSNQARADHLAAHITNFYIWLGLFVVLLAGSLWVNDVRRPQTWGRQPILAVGASVVLFAFSLYFINSVNINLVRADIYFKLGQNADARRDWRTSLIFYEQATEAAPNEDHYQLFRGRALLESARAATDPTQQQVFLNRAEEVLLNARELNPLNTDHTANLARYYATLSSAQTEESLRQEALNKATVEYAQATTLSPNAAHLQNEWGTIYVELGESEKARERFAHSLELDATFSDTYLRIAQLETREENWEAAAENYQKAIELSPKELRAFNGLGFVLAQLKRYQEAADTYLEALDFAPNNLSILQNLTLIYQEMGLYEEALVYAERARSVTPEDQRANINALIQQLRQQSQQG